MTTLTRIFAALALTLWLCSVAQPQVIVDVSKITCDQFTIKVKDPQKIAIWLSGYYHGRRDSTLVDTQQLDARMDRIKRYCLHNPEATVMSAVERVFAPNQ